MQIKQEPSSAEWEVLKVIWTLDKPTSRSISTVLKETQNWENATTKTLLGRLVKKGFLNTLREGNRFIYEATVTQEEGSNQRLLDVADAFCTKSRGKAIAHLIDHLQLSLEDKDLLLDAIAEKEFNDQLECTCLHGCQCAAGKCECGHHHN